MNMYVSAVRVRRCMRMCVCVYVRVLCDVDVCMCMAYGYVLAFAHLTPCCCANESDNNLGVGGINALIPALTQMPHLTTLNLQGKSRVLRLHDGVCWLGTSK